MPDDAPAGYRPAGTVTVTLRFQAGPVLVRGAVLEHEGCGDLVSLAGIGDHERLVHPEAGEGR